MNHKNLFDQKHIVIQPAMSIGEMREVDTDDFYYRMERYYSSLGNPSVPWPWVHYDPDSDNNDQETQDQTLYAFDEHEEVESDMAASDQASNASTTATEVHVIDAWGVIHANVQDDESDNDDEGDGNDVVVVLDNDTDDFDYMSHISTHVPSDDNVSELTEGVATDNLSPDDLSTNDVSTDDDHTDDLATDDVSTHDDGKDEEIPQLSYQSGFMSCLFCAKRRRLL